MPKVLQINIVVNWGSTGRIAEQIGEKAMARGWESYIAYGVWKNPSASKLIGIGSSCEYRWHKRLTKYTDKHGLFSSWATLRFIRKVKKIKPDIVHLHNIHGYYINYKILFNYLRKANIPVVWTLHDCWPITGHCAYFIGADCQRWQTECYDCPLLNDYPYARRDNSRANHQLKREVFTSLGEKLHLVSVSKWLGGVIDKSFFAGSGVDSTVIYNGVDSAAFRPCKSATKTELGIGDKKMLVAAASTWEARKNLGDIYKLSEMLPTEYQAVVVGLSPIQIKEAPASVIALPRTNSVGELARLYSAADVVLNLSSAETFGLTTAEGMLCGTPSIVYNATASPELVTPQTGRIVEQGDLEGVVKAVEELCAEDREEMRRRCREYAVEHFDRDKNYEKYLDLYEKLLTNK